MRLTPKAARRLGLVPDAPKPTTTTKRQPVSRRAGYTNLGLLGWQFATTPAGVYAFRCHRDGTVERTERLPPGDGDNLGQHYRRAIEAIDRGDYETEGPT